MTGQWTPPSDDDLETAAAVLLWLRHTKEEAHAWPETLGAIDHVAGLIADANSGAALAAAVAERDAGHVSVLDLP